MLYGQTTVLVFCVLYQSGVEGVCIKYCRLVMKIGD